MGKPQSRSSTVPLQGRQLFLSTRSEAEESQTLLRLNGKI